MRHLLILSAALLLGGLAGCSDGISLDPTPADHSMFYAGVRCGQLAAMKYPGATNLDALAHNEYLRITGYGPFAKTVFKKGQPIP